MIAYNSNRKGFTLSEVLIVMAIVVVLAGISVPIFNIALSNYQRKRVQDQETAAKAAAVTAFYTGYDSKGNPVDITENNSGYCTFLYDESNGSVYVINSKCGASGFTADYASSIERYGINVFNGKDYSDQVILVSFDGRYNKNVPKDPSKGGCESRGACEEPIIKVQWEQADAVLFVGG